MTTTSKLILKRNGFSALLVDSSVNSLSFKIESPYEDAEVNDVFRGELLAFKNLLSQTDLVRKARKDGKKITFEVIYRPE